MPTVRFLREGCEVDVRVGETLRVAARRAGVCLYSHHHKLLNCYGHGRCGKCRSVVTEGWDRLSGPTDREHNRAAPGKRERLACQTKILGDIEIWSRPAEGGPPKELEPDPVVPGRRLRKGPVAVTGGTGLLGRAVVAELLRRGRDVRALVRPGRDGSTPEGVEEVIGDINSARAMETLCAGASAVIHLASLMGTMDAERLEVVNVEGTRTVLEAADSAGVPRFVLVSSIAARRPGDGPYSASKWAQEEIVRRGTVPWVILQPPVMLGPGSQVENAVRELATKGPLVPVIGGDAPLYPVHVDDVATACVEACKAKAALTGRTYQLGGPDALTFEELVARILGEGGERDTLALPVPVAHAAGAVLGTVLGDRAPLTSEGVKAVVAGTPVDLSAAREDLKFDPRPVGAYL